MEGNAKEMGTGEKVTIREKYAINAVYIHKCLVQIKAISLASIG